ncbi:MAG: transcriptional regulator MraZ [Rhodocyclaceae bacterium]|nr:transcriptional regulator MraZ [Rhodocyclaceae bacterium]
MFQGATQLSLDAKGRMAIPARHRDELVKACDGRLVLTGHPHRCLLLYPEPAWLPVQEQLSKLSSIDPRTASIKRVMMGNALPTELDSAGRLLLAPELRDYAGFDKQVFLVGMGSHFEIWSEAGWKRENARAEESVQSLGLPPALEGLEL